MNYKRYIFIKIEKNKIECYLWQWWNAWATNVQLYQNAFSFCIHKPISFFFGKLDDIERIRSWSSNKLHKDLPKKKKKIKTKQNKDLPNFLHFFVHPKDLRKPQIPYSKFKVKTQTRLKQTNCCHNGPTTHPTTTTFALLSCVLILP